MQLDEAKEILKLNGYLLEDTETNDEEMDELNSKWSRKFSDARVSDKTLINLNKKMQNTIDKHMDLEDKINNAKRYNEEHPAWERMSDKEKAVAILKLIDDGYEFMDENPLNPDSSDIFADFYDIPELADVWDKATEKLEDIYLSDENNWSSGWDDWLFSYGDDILVDILKGKDAKQIVKEYRSALD